MYDISYLGPRTDIAKLLINCNLPLYIEISSHRIDIRLMLTMTDRGVVLMDLVMVVSVAVGGRGAKALP